MAAFHWLVVLIGEVVTIKESLTLYRPILLIIEIINLYKVDYFLFIFNYLY
jgi:hypothetical protein